MSAIQSKPERLHLESWGLLSYDTWQDPLRAITEEMQQPPASWFGGGVNGNLQCRKNGK